MSKSKHEPLTHDLNHYWCGCRLHLYDYTTKSNTKEIMNILTVTLTQRKKIKQVNVPLQGEIERYKLLVHQHKKK